MLAGETAAVAAGTLAGVEFAGRVAGVVPLPASPAPSAPVEVLTGEPTGTMGSEADFEGASLVEEGLVVSAGGAAAAVEFESGAGSWPFPDSFAASRGFSEEGCFDSFFASEAEGFSSFFGLGWAGASVA